MGLKEIELTQLKFRQLKSARLVHWCAALSARFIFIVLVITLIGNVAEVYSQQLPAKSTSTPYLIVLGTLQDAGFPQAGCYQDHCLPAWEDASRKRGAVSIGMVDPQNKQKFMIEATPDFPEQLYTFDKIAPIGEYEFSGIFLTHAHIGHYAGLMHLGQESMNASHVPVFAMPRMADFLRQNGPWSQLVSLKNIQLNTIESGQTTSIADFKVTPFLVPHRDEYSETVGYRIKGPNKTGVFIPDINKWSDWGEDIAELVSQVDYALLDATFFADGELVGRDMSKIPHPFVTESVEALKALPLKDRNKVWFTHLNHTNPLLDVQSKEAKWIVEQGYNIAVEGTRLSF